MEIDLKDSITVYLSNRAPRTLKLDEWPILVQSDPKAEAAQHLVVRVHATKQDAIVYAHKGTGSGVVGAGLYAGEILVDCNSDLIAQTIFSVGRELNFDLKLLWTLVQQLAPVPMTEG